MLSGPPLGEQGGQFLDHRARCPIAAIPGDLESTAGEIFQQAGDIFIFNIDPLLRAASLSPVSALCHGAEFQNIRAKKRPALEHHLEAVIIGGIVAAGDHDAALDLIQYRFGIIKHRSGAHSDRNGIDSGIIETPDKRRFQHRRTGPPIISGGHRAAAIACNQRPETATNRISVILAQRFSDNPANVIFA